MNRASAAAGRRFKPYPAYKDSDVEWLGAIPAHWEMRRLKLVSTVIMGQSPPSEHYNTLGDGPPFLQGNADFGTEHPEPRVFCPVAPKTVKAGDHLISVRAPVGALNTADQDYGIGRGLCAVRIRPPLVDNRFARWSLAVSSRGLDTVAVGSTYEAVSAEDVSGLAMPLPQDTEQRAIAALLDRVTARIDALVAKKERLIELLQEKRTALITRAVTKGLDPNVPMKDSGVEWLGEIPAHWECLALARVTVSRCDGPFGSGLKSEHYSSAGVRVVRLQNIGWTEFSDSDQAYLDEAYAHELGEHSVLAGDMLIAGLGDEGHPVGRACVAPEGIEPAMVKADCFRFRLDRRRVLPTFASFQLSATALAAAGSLATGATRSRMNLTTTAARKVALPPPDEQQAIVGFLDREEEKFRALTGHVRDAITRLKELRTALISAAVTGKIDVREEVAA